MWALEYDPDFSACSLQMPVSFMKRVSSSPSHSIIIQVETITAAVAVHVCATVTCTSVGQSRRIDGPRTDNYVALADKIIALFPAIELFSHGILQRRNLLDIILG